MKKLIAALALGASIATVAAPESLVVQASTINDTAKQNSYGGVTYLDQMLAQEGVQYNDFLLPTLLIIVMASLRA